MRYDEYNGSIKRNGTKYNSGYESAGFESFDRDACVYFADTAKTVSVDGWGWSPQGTSSMSYVSDNGEISTLTSSIAALNSCASGIKSNVETVGRALNAMSRRLQEQPHWSDKLDLKNRFNRGSRDLRSQLLTV